jgi:hydrogenase nickel incorporation protein HypB
MCATCGCGEETVRVTAFGPGQHHADSHHADSHHADSHHADQHHADHHQGEHHHDDDRTHAHDVPTRTVLIEEDVLSKNDRLAEGNRAWLAERAVVAVNLMSSPGSGKTTLLERTVRELSASTPVCVVEGDQETLLDAERIRATGCPVVQINTGAGCHLDAAMLQRGLLELDPSPGALVFVENVGNLVCPALFDLGETRRVVVMSVTEGADKPLKYPHMFTTADLVLVNKTDLLPYVDFDLARCADNVGKVNPRAKLLHVSATQGNGVTAWYDWLHAAR